MGPCPSFLLTPLPCRYYRAIWIGPAQQTGQPCSLLWPTDPLAHCRATGFQTWRNIVLRNVTIDSPAHSPGVLLGNASHPIADVVFDRVVVTNPGSRPWGKAFYK
jgi:hypothetical protein